MILRMGCLKAMRRGLGKGMETRRSLAHDIYYGN